MAKFETRRRWALPALIAAVALLALASCSLGKLETVGPRAVLQVFAHWLGIGGAGGPEVEANASIVLHLRLPRVALAVLAGAALAMAGAALQGLFRNPLADPALIGVSSGAAVGGAAVIVWGGTHLAWLTGALDAFSLPVAALATGLGVTFIIYSLAKVEGRTHLVLMLLTGIAVNALAMALIGLLIYTGTDAQIRELSFWMLGSLLRASWPQIGAAALIALPAMLALPFLSRPLNALLLGEAEAHHLGVPVQQVKRLLVILSATMVGATVAVCGTIGFLGLVAPHLVRLTLGPDHRTLLPASGLLGAALLLVSDIAARFLGGSYAELPIGVVTALAGAPFFLALLLRERSRGTVA